MVENKEQRLIVNLNHLRKYNQEYAKGLLDAPMDYLPCFDKALRDVVEAAYAPGAQDANKLYYVGFEGSFGANLVSPRNLCAKYLGKMMCVEGIVTRCTRPILVNLFRLTCPAKGGQERALL